MTAPHRSLRRRVGVLSLACVSLFASCGADRTASGAGDNDRPPAPVPTGDRDFVRVDDRLIVTRLGVVYRRDASEHEGTTDRSPIPMTWEVARLTSDGYARLDDILDGLGFHEPPPDYGNGTVGVAANDPASGASSSEIAIVVGNDYYRHNVRGLDADLSDPAAADARDRFRETTEVLLHLEDHLGAGIGPFEPYVPQSWRVTIHRGDTAGADPWPFAERVEAGCTRFLDDDVVVDGRDAMTGRYTHPNDRWVVDVQATTPFNSC